jgi:transposase
MMYSGIDLHSNNSVVSVIDDADRVVAQKRLPNDITKIVGFLARWQNELAGVVVESTYNWYWLVDGLQDAGLRVHLANTAAIKQYDGLKHSGDETDAQHLAHLLRSRCVDSVHTSNRKKKGEGNVKNGNKYLAWAFVEAANFAVRFCSEAKRFHERKKAKTNNIVATKALAHKLARACYHILKKGKPFDATRCFT